MVGSEITRLLQQIREEEEAARRGLHEYATVSRHQYITSRMENVSHTVDALANVLGSKDVLLDLIVLYQMQTQNIIPHHEFIYCTYGFVM
jgi:hypothetical protein